MNFAKHPSEQLSKLYRQKPFQGQVPDLAKIIFISSDANYSPEITDHKFFDSILEYHQDGVAFWKKYGVHHPFLLSTFPFNKTSGGRPFHSRFSRLNLDSSYATDISFVELLDIPTIGNKSSDRTSFYKLVTRPHLNYLDNLIMSGGQKLFFVSNGVLKDMYKMRSKYHVFNWLDRQNSIRKYSKKIGTNKIKEIYHFSSSQIYNQIAEIRETIDTWLGNP